MMKLSELRKKLKNFRNLARNLFNNSESSIGSSSYTWIERIKLGSTKPQVFAYQLIGEKITKLLPIFKDLEVSIRKSGMKANFKAYICTTILASLILATSTMLFVSLILFFIFKLSLFLSILFAAGASLFAGALTVIGFYIYPSYRADTLKRALDDDLTFTVGYMSILAGAGVPPDFIWRSLAQIDVSIAVSNIAKNVVRDVELFGFDVISALETTSMRTSSERFKELIEGFISVVHSGGSLVNYLRNRSKQYMKLKQISLKRFSDTLGVLAEFYVTLMVAGSLIFVVMLAVMSMLGGGGFGPLDSILLLNLLTYIGLPVGSMIFLVILDMTSPKR